jgi:hypothetical protein
MPSSQPIAESPRMAPIMDLACPPEIGASPRRDQSLRGHHLAVLFDEGVGFPRYSPPPTMVVRGSPL